MPNEPIGLCPLEQCPEGQPVAVETFIDGQVESLIIWHNAGELRVFLNICPHAGRRLDYAPGKFLVQNDRLICAAHGAAFTLQDGHCLSGPCRGQALHTLAARVIDGMICLPATD